jgi:hypothetical protein
LAYEVKIQAWIAYKESSQAKAGTFKPRIYYHTEWQSPETLTLRLEGLNMDSIYEGFVRQIAGDRLNATNGEDLRDSVIRDGKRQKLLREIAALENKIRREKQFNRQVEMNSELKRLRVELKELE